MALTAAIVALAIRGGATLDTVFELFEALSWRHTFLIFIVIPLYLMITYVFSRFIFMLLLQLYDVFFDNFRGLSVLSVRKTRFFVNQLIDLYDFEKYNIKMQASSGDIVKNYEA